MPSRVVLFFISVVISTTKVFECGQGRVFTSSKLQQLGVWVWSKGDGWRGGEGVFNCYNFLTALRHAICQQPLTAGIAIWKIWYLAWILEMKMIQTIGAQASKISPIFERKTGSPCQPWFCLAVEILRKTPPDGFELIITCATMFHNTLLHSWPYLFAWQ